MFLSSGTSSHYYFNYYYYSNLISSVVSELIFHVMTILFLRLCYIILCSI